MTTTDSTTLARPATRSLAIVPLRVFLGATFVDAGLGKLLSAAYLGTGPRGFAAQARGFARGSPIGWLVRAVALPHPMAAGLLLAVALARVQQVCADAGRQGRCPGAIGRTCRGEQCPLTPRPAGPVAFDASRWALLVRGALAAVALTVTGVVGGGVAAAERLLGGDADGGGGLASLPSQPTQPTRPSARRATPGHEQPPSGTRIGSLGDIAVGHAAAFTTPSGRPAVAVRLGERQVVAFSAVCTHAGCTVGYDSGSRLLACPCHGAEFDPARGAAAVAGPTSTPLPAITLHLASDGGLYLPHSG